MPLAFEQFSSGTVANGTTLTVTSWTPGANNLLLLTVHIRDENVLPSSVSGNGVTWTKIQDSTNTQNQMHLQVYRALDASPSTGAITITFPSSQEAANAVVCEFSGVDTGGTNGSAAVQNEAIDLGPGSDNNDCKISVTISDTTNNWCFGSLHSRAPTITSDPAETVIVNSVVAGSGGGTVRTAVFYEDAPANPQEMGQDNNLSSNTDWMSYGFEIVQAPAVAASPRTNIQGPIVGPLGGPV